MILATLANEALWELFPGEIARDETKRRRAEALDLTELSPRQLRGLFPGEIARDELRRRRSEESA